MEPKDYLGIFWRRRWLIALAVSIASGVSLWLSSTITPTYVANAAVFIGPRTVEREDFGGAFQELLFSKELVASYAAMFERLPLLERVIELERTPFGPGDLRSRISTRIVPETRIIEVSVRDVSPERASRITNTLVRVFLDDIQESFGGAAPATLLEPAVRPTSPVSPIPARDGVLGAILGLLVGVGSALLLEQTSTTIRAREEAERWLSPLPVLATVPSMGNGEAGKLVVNESVRAPASEAFRILRTSLHFLSVERPVRRLLVTSPYAQEGKTTIAANLAAAFAAAGFRTVLIDADLRRPMVHEMFGLPLRPGLSEALVTQTDASRVARRTEVEKLSVIPAGGIPPNPSEVLGSGRMMAALNRIEQSCDVIILDTPPALPVADASALAPFIDGALLVIRAGRTRRGHAKQTIDGLERIGVRVLGTVLNGLREGHWDYYRRYYAYDGLLGDDAEAALTSADRLATLLEPAPAKPEDRTPPNAAGKADGDAGRPGEPGMRGKGGDEAGPAS